MKIDPRIQQIWWVRGVLGPRGMRSLTAVRADPTNHPGLRRTLLREITWYDRRVPWADDRGLLKHGPGQLVDEPPAIVLPWAEVWAMIAPGITEDRVAELRAAWYQGAAYRAVHGEHYDMRLHLACCAFFSPVPVVRPVQLDMFELLAAA